MTSASKSQIGVGAAVSQLASASATHPDAGAVRLPCVPTELLLAVLLLLRVVPVTLMSCRVKEIRPKIRPLVGPSCSPSRKTKVLPRPLAEEVLPLVLVAEHEHVAEQLVEAEVEEVVVVVAGISPGLLFVLQVSLVAQLVVQLPLVLFGQDSVS